MLLYHLFAPGSTCCNLSIQECHSSNLVLKLSTSIKLPSYVPTAFDPRWRPQYDLVRSLLGYLMSSFSFPSYPSVILIPPILPQFIPLVLISLILYILNPIFVFISLCLPISLMELKLLSPRIIYLLMSTSLGSAIFCMHFVGMGSIRLETQAGEAIPIYFDIGLTLVSLVAAIAFVHVGLIISSRDRAYIRTRTQIAEMTVEDASSMSIKQIQATNMTTLVLFRDLRPLVLGGVVTGSGVVVMHYVGMKAVIFSGEINSNVGIVAASIIIAIITATAAFWILFRFLAVYPHVEGYRILGAILMAIAMCGMHYTGAAAAQFDYTPDAHNSTVTALMSSYIALMATLLFGVLYPFLVVFIMFADIRQWIYSRNSKMDRIDSLIKTYQLTAAMSRDKQFDIETFVSKYEAINAGKHQRRQRTPSSAPSMAETEWSVVKYMKIFRNEVYPGGLASRKGSAEDSTIITVQQINC